LASPSGGSLSDLAAATPTTSISELELSGDPPCLGGRERNVNRSGGVHVQVIEQHTDNLDI
jgi:hypothetical protein